MGGGNGKFPNGGFTGNASEYSLWNNASIRGAAMGEMTHDGIEDIIMIRDNELRTYRSNGADGHGRNQFYHNDSRSGTVTNYLDLGLGDFNSDGSLDVVTIMQADGASNRLQYFIRNTSGTSFTASTTSLA